MWTGYFAGIEKTMMYVRTSASMMKRHVSTSFSLERLGESLQQKVRASSVCRR